MKLSVRSRLALVVFLTGLATAAGCIVAVALAFQRFEHESIWQRGDAFLARVAEQHPDMLDLQQRNPEEFRLFLRNLMLYEPGSQLYLLAPDGAVLASTGQAQLPREFRVAMDPVRTAAATAGRGSREAAYVMGDDPEFMESDAVVAARALRRSVIRPDADAAGYLYLVCRSPRLALHRLQLLGMSFDAPALLPVALVIVLASALATWIIITVTRPLRVLSDEVAAATQLGFTGEALVSPPEQGQMDDEFGRLRGGFHALLAALRQQWDELRRLDSFRRESVSNLSHDLRSPLTATVACLETLQNRWAGDATRQDDTRLLETALRNTRNAAGMVRALGDLAQLDEPAFQLRPMRLDLGEVLDDITLRFAERARRQGVALSFVQEEGAPPVAEVDTELFERAVANLLDNALKHTPAGRAVRVSVVAGDGELRVAVADEGAGIAAEHLPHLFDRHYQARDSVAPATSEEGKGLGLAIVKRIVELHQGRVEVQSTPGQGTRVTLVLPA